MKIPDYTEQINRGVAYLDEKHPKWLPAVNINILDMNSCYECVLGQLLGDFYSRNRGLRYDVAAKHGFLCDPKVYDTDGYPTGVSPSRIIDYHYNVLTIQWQVKILQLQHERQIITV